ncbi:hypothetical protein, partial [Enterococcus hirae]|uniref:hypothetical protein n=1 Tax=Enterococcus hirae TaxID=1354 RepID=UPI002554E3AF
LDNSPSLSGGGNLNNGSSSNQQGDVQRLGELLEKRRESSSSLQSTSRIAGSTSPVRKITEHNEITEYGSR